MRYIVFQKLVLVAAVKHSQVFLNTGSLQRVFTTLSNHGDTFHSDQTQYSHLRCLIVVRRVVIINDVWFLAWEGFVHEQKKIENELMCVLWIYLLLEQQMSLWGESAAPFTRTLNVHLET